MNVLPPGTQLENRYVVDSVVGQGGFAVVYLAQDRQMNGARVAIKQFNSGAIPPDELPAFKHQFMQEALILRDLNHPRIPRVYGCFEQHDTQFLVMDYVEGTRLDSLSGPQLQVADALRYGQEIADTLAYLHAQAPHPVIHKDLKPNNVIVTAKGCVLLDFGISKAVSSDGQYSTRTVMRGLGTDGYAAPEVHNGNASSPSVDLYALGATLYALLSGKTPISAATRQQCIFNGSPDPLEPLQASRTDLPEPLIHLIHRLLMLQLAQRVQTAGEVVQILQAILAGTAPPGWSGPAYAPPAAAYPPSPIAPGTSYPSSGTGYPPAGYVASLPPHPPAGYPSYPTPGPASSTPYPPAGYVAGSVPYPPAGYISSPSAGYSSSPPLAASSTGGGELTNGASGAVHASTSTRPEDLISPAEMEALIAGSNARLRKPRRRWGRAALGIAALSGLVYLGRQHAQWLDKVTSPLPSPKPELTKVGTNAAGAAEHKTSEGLVLILIPGGTFTMGSSSGDSDQRPAHPLTLPSYYIGKHPVTNRQYQQFVRATNYKASAEWMRSARWGDEAPAVGISHADAMAYCAWSGLRLPTEAEWELAARGPRSRQYPWGDTWDTNRLWFRGNSFERARPVGTRPEGASPYGCTDMAGNVLEWCSSLYHPYPYRASDGREAPSSVGERVLRGGCWNDLEPTDLRCARRVHDLPTRNDNTTGFRVARSL